MYKLYAQNKKGVWKLIDKSKELGQIYIEIDKITPKEYYKYMIKDEKPKTDDIIEIRDLYKECKIEIKENINSKYEIKATTFKPSKMKKKEELRKMTEEYLR